MVLDSAPLSAPVEMLWSQIILIAASALHSEQFHHPKIKAYEVSHFFFLVSNGKLCMFKITTHLVEHTGGSQASIVLSVRTES